MSDDAGDEAERPTRDDVLGHVHEAIDGSEYRVHAIIPCGGNDVLWFFIVVWSVPHREVEGATMLNERYFQIPKDWSDEFSPTFKKNGINRRDMSGLALTLQRAYSRANQEKGDDIDWLAEDDPLWLDDERA